MKRILFSILAIIFSSLIVFSITSYINTNNEQLAKKQYMENSYNQNDYLENNAENIIDENDIIFNFTNYARLGINASDNSAIKEEADFVILGTINSIDGTINYNPTQKLYTMPQTIGELTVDKVIKGNLNENKISFIKTGGVLSVEEYEKCLSNIEKEKMGLDNMSISDKRNKYVSQYFQDDIKTEKNKQYLMYLNYNSDYDKYAISFLQYGLREIKIEGYAKQNSLSEVDSYESMANIKVKNNVTGEWENLNEII